MKNRYVRDLQPNENVTTSFLVQSKEVRLRKTGEPYLSLQLSDRTGQLEAKKWEDVEEVVDAFERDDFIKVHGVVQNYRNRPQMTILRLRRLDDSEVELEDYLPHTEKDIGEMFAGVQQAVGEMRNPHLRELLLSFLDDPEIAARLKRAPAAKSMHHAYIGGLLEHMSSLLNLARLTAGNYDFIDLDLLTAGVMLHDLGKIYELTYQRSFGYSTEGQLLGHIVIVLRMLDQRCGQIENFPAKLKTLLEHMILSHHGKYEFGSPKLPMFAEALLLHYLDDLDSKLESVRASAAADTQEEDWTRYNPSLERSILKKERFLESAETAAGDIAGDEKRGQREAGQAGGPKTQAPGSPGKTMSLFGEQLRAAIDEGAEKE